MAKTLAVVIGRFGPTHKYHAKNLLALTQEYDHTIVLLGTSLTSRDIKNPFLWQQRRDMIKMTCKDLGMYTGNMSFYPVRDYMYSRNDNAWIFQVQEIVNTKMAELEADGSEWTQPEIVGVNKDDSSYYLKNFPQWTSHIVQPVRFDSSYTIGATDIRAAMFEDRWSDIANHVTFSVREYLKEWITTEEGDRLKKEYHANLKNVRVLGYPLKDEDGNEVRDSDGRRLLVEEEKYRPISVTTDNVITWRGHVLLIRRRSHPGKGLWALPGGFLEADETVDVGAFRELEEETKIKYYSNDTRVPLSLNKNWYRNSKVFDYPFRSRRGRTITTAFHLVIPDEFEVDIEPSSDADRVQWFSLLDVKQMGYELFEDHQDIIEHFTR